MSDRKVCECTPRAPLGLIRDCLKDTPCASEVLAVVRGKASRRAQVWGLTRLLLGAGRQFGAGHPSHE